MDFDNLLETITPTQTPVLTISSTGAIGVPSGTTAQRPASPVGGMVRYNTDVAAMETYVSGAWVLNASTIDAVRCASTANVTISAPGAALDGVTLAVGDRILLKDQTTASENGIYIWNGAAVAATRATDMSTDWNGTVPGRIVFANEGNTSQFFNFRFVAAFNGTFGTTAITVTGGWQQSGRITFGNMSTPTRAATGSATPTDFQLISTTANARVWKFATGGTSVVTGLEMAIGTNDDVANAANTWWDVSLSSDTQEGVRFARRTGGTVAPKFFLDLNGRITVGSTVLASGATGAALGSTAGVVAYFNSTDAIKLPVGTTAQRPTPSVGMMRYNNDIAKTEYYNGSAWVAPGGILQTVIGTINSSSGNTAMPYDNTVPASTEGTQLWTLSFTPLMSTSTIVVTTNIFFATANFTTVSGATFNGTTNIGSQMLGQLLITGTLLGATSFGNSVSMIATQVSGSTAARTYSFRAGAATAVTVFFNQGVSGQAFGSATNSGRYMIQEIAP